jgi:short subunit dehydrogenase-like uncharacterized protein
MDKVDIVIWGATGFTGQLLANYLWSNYGKKGDIKLALGGRDLTALKELSTSIGANNAIDIIVGDAFDMRFLDEMTQHAKVIVSTVGPYAKYGSKLVEACAQNGCDYCDLAGEPQWILEMITTYQDTAIASGARIVNSCGFDSIPSDFGVYFLQQRAIQRDGKPLTSIKMRVKAMKGGVSGGTIASLFNIIEDIRNDPSLAKRIKNPYALVTNGQKNPTRQPNANKVQYDTYLKKWLAPFVMAGINCKIVHRSNALSNYSYGLDFTYEEAVSTGDGWKGKLKALTYAYVLKSIFIGATFKPTRTLMKQLFLPKPGQGPSEEKRESGFYSLIFEGRDAQGNVLCAEVNGDKDPGYGSTCKMLGESALCLLNQRRENKVGTGGFYTPSIALGDELLKRLETNAGLSFS